MSNSSIANNSQTPTQVAASSWFSTSSNPPVVSIWPWAHMSSDQYQQLYTAIIQLKIFLDICKYLGIILYFIGIIGSLFILFTVFTKTNVTVTFFYPILASIAIFDLFFLLLKFFRWVSQLVTQTPAVVLFYNSASGIAYTCSLMSDMLALSLTIERFVGLVAPIFYINIGHHKERMAWLLGGFVSLLISCTRMHYTFDTVIFGNVSLRNQDWFLAISFISDNVLPFALLVIMVILVVGILKAVYNRQKNAKNKVLSRTSGDGGGPIVEDRARIREKETMKTISLIAALVIMFILNQVGYVLYAIGALLTAKSSISYTNSLHEIESYLAIYVYYKTAVGLSSPIEIVSRAIVFYVYLWFSGSFRNDLIVGLKRFGLWK